MGGSLDRVKMLSIAGGDPGVLILRGELDLATAPVLAAALAGAVPVDVLDLRGITFIDVAGLTAVVRAVRARHGSRPLLVRPSAPVVRVAELAGWAGELVRPGATGRTTPARSWASSFRTATAGSTPAAG